MPSKKKTTKPARGITLRRKKQDPPPDEPVGTAPAAVPPIVSSLAPDAAVSVQIKNALEDALDGELGAMPAQPAAPQPEPTPGPQPAPVEQAPAPAEPEPAPEPPAEGPVSAPATAQPAHKFMEPENPGYINVMQVLVEEKAPKYVEMFGLCSCKRCMEDVKALTLNHLPPKYVVLEPGDRVPRLTVYEGKFSSDITAQLLQACKLVMERPHHSR